MIFIIEKQLAFPKNIFKDPAWSFLFGIMTKGIKKTLIYFFKDRQT